MQHFSFLDESELNDLFLIQPNVIDADSSRETIATGLGASLYTPATRENIVGILQKNVKRGVGTSILCLEDSIPDDQVAEAEQNLVRTLAEIKERNLSAELPILFVRVRNPDHLRTVAEQNEDHLDVLTGFVLPKFSNEDYVAEAYSYEMEHINANRGINGKKRLYYMPVLETPDLVYRETRQNSLSEISRIIQKDRRDILAVRIGATDMSSPYGLRRSRDLTIYDVHVVASAIGDIVNMFARADDSTGMIVTGAVWEHFTDRERLFKPRLRATPFEEDQQQTRKEIILNDLDGLIREVELDRANGLLGKTAIHPLHVALINSMYVVTHEEYSDACDILGKEETGGAVASTYRNKMNEHKPHLAWAKKTLLRAQAFGVAAEGKTFADFLEMAMNKYE